jgi:hypothetical protein
VVGAAWPWRARHVAPGEWDREAVRRTGGPQRTVRRAKAGLGVRYGGARAARVAPASRRRARRRALALGVLALFHLGLFNYKFL